MFSLGIKWKILINSKNPLKIKKKDGDLKIEFNWEFRFKVIGNFESAFFVDAGNIWLRQKDDKRPLAEFDINRFYKELAIGTGLGIRFDVGFFIIRLDGGWLSG